MKTDYTFMKLVFNDERQRLFTEWLEAENKKAIESDVRMAPEANIRAASTRISDPEWLEASMHTSFVMTYAPTTIGDVITFKHRYTGSVLDLSLVDDESW